MTLLLTRSDLSSLLDPAECVDVVEEAFRGQASAKSLGFHASEGTFHIKAAMADVFAAKINANFPENPRAHGLPTVQGVVVVMETERGSTLAILDSATVTTLRTAAATAVAARYLARGDARTLAIIGCGVQGRASIDALRAVRPIREVRTFDADRTRSSASSIDEAVEGADIIVTCTPSRTAILDAHHLRPGVFIAAVGADNPQKQELTPALLRRSKVVPDILEQAATMGDLHHAIESGAMRREDVHGELADVITGRAPARTADDEIFVFDSTGSALQDVALASLAVRRAIERGVGAQVSFRA